MKKGFIYSRTAELTWRARLTWRAGPAQMRHSTQGHVAEPPRPTRRTCGTYVASTHGKRPRGSTQTPVRGLACDGHLLEFWGGNAIALNSPPIYTHVSLFFISCRTMFQRN